jgi:integrase
LTLLLSTGVRKSSLHAARWDEINWQTVTWTIPATKNGDPHTVQLTPKALSVLKERFKSRKRDNPWIFPSPISASGHVEDFKRGWNQFVKRAGLSNITQHDLRRTNASYQVISGSSLKVVGGSLGHKSQASTEVYAHLHADAVRQSMIAGEKQMQLMAAAAKKRQKQLSAGGTNAS